MSEQLITIMMCGLSATGIILCTYLFLSLKHEVSQLRRILREKTQDAARETVQLHAEMIRLRQSVEEVDRKADQIPQIAPPKPALNTTRRSQILRLHSQGKRSDEIASTLGVPRGEVDLLLKLHPLGKAS